MNIDWDRYQDINDEWYHRILEDEYYSDEEDGVWYTCEREPHESIEYIH